MSGTGDGPGDVLLTGATGFLGMELLARYLERTDRTVLALVRAPDLDRARARIDTVLELLFGRADIHPSRVVAIPADIEQDGLGLTDSLRELVAARTSEIVHCAATVSFVSELKDARRINVDGTSNLLRLATECANRGTLRRFVHVSTAYVAGTHDGEFGEHDLDVGQRFRNPYERTKYEAEQRVREHAAELPAVTIVRPSIIVGESTTGWTPSFNVLYVPLRAFALRRLRLLPADPSAPVDVVPVDHVADAIMHLTETSDRGLSTYHLVAAERAATVEQLVELSARQLGLRPPPLVSPRLYRAARPALVACAGGRRRAALERVAPFLPYYTMRVRYRRDRAGQRLDPAGLEPPPLRSYYHRLVQYAVATNWNRRPQPRPRAAAPSVASTRP
ncbi:MAG TPA: SDR family oxidoreductase [Solirubrobacteraceae bacterium]|nr:SDR family oxidoreductase [Solirubrobacteraceae bacterium]